ncbi:MAG: hypothetical protein JW860_09595 [Sedimentisphaerales bacterium]|nr:hypothetical protein [Sedimentisphaerales bacterium]
MLHKFCIQQTDISDWHELAGFHHRRQLGLADKIFSLRIHKEHINELDNKTMRDFFKDSPDRSVGVIVYGMPVANLALRNLATANRYTGWGSNRVCLELLNREIRCIHRVVIHPAFRRMGLACHLVSQTLPQAGTALVEAITTLNSGSRLFARAGMTRYERPLAQTAIQLQEAFHHVGIDIRQLVYPHEIIKEIHTLAKSKKQFLVRQIRQYAQRFNRRLRLPSYDTAGNPADLSAYLSVAREHLFSNPVYFLWAGEGSAIEAGPYQQSLVNKYG